MYAIVYYAQYRRHWVRLGKNCPPIETIKTKKDNHARGGVPMDTLKKLAGKSIVTVIAAYSLLLILFPVGWIVLLGTAIGKPSAEERSVEARILGADLEV